jgi:hypothetical protein
LIAFAFNCRSQQLNDFIIVKYQRLTAQFAQGATPSSRL